MASHIPRGARGLAPAAFAAALLLGPSTPAQDPRAPAPAGPAAGAASDPGVFLERVEAAWQTRDLDAWMALWASASDAELALERAAARTAFEADETVLTFLRRPEPGAADRRFSAEVQVFTVEEPRARVAFWTLHFERGASGWALSAREESGQMDGLVHLSLGPRAFRARNLPLRFQDFDLLLEDGTLFTSPDPVGPTLVVFVGRGRARFAPAPAAEREQLRQFSGRTAIDREVGWAFLRLQPVELLRLLGTRVLEDEKPAPSRRAEAERVFRARAERSFVVDAPLPRSPWWLLPGHGDAVVDFPWGRKHVLTFALTAGEAEDVNLFDRDRGLQICSYASSGRVDYNEDDEREIDVLEHDLSVRFEPERFELSAVHRMRIKLLVPAATLRLRLHDDFRVSSVQTGSGGSLLFFRVRGQDTLVVSLGPLASRSEPFTLVTRYSGRHDPAPVEHEVVQIGRPAGPEGIEDIFVDPPPIVYANRTAWYPRPPEEDFAPARLRFDTPAGWLAVSGGELVSASSAAARTRSEYRLTQPGKFVTTIVGRLSDVGMRQEGARALRGYAGARVRRETLEDMEEAERMLAFYAQKFGPLPYPTLGMVVAEAEVPAGHSPPGLLYLQKRPPILRARALPDDPATFSDYPGFFLAHEAAHQWWGQGTAPENYRERWLSEAWAQYAAALWLRERSGERAFQSMMDRMAAWALRHDDAGPIHLGQRLGHLRREPRYFRAVVYDKGAWVLHMLRGLVGDEAFFAGARSFLERHRYAKAGTEDLRAALEASSGVALKPYFDRWIYETGLPRVVWSARTAEAEGRFRTTFEARAAGLPGPLPLLASVVTASGVASEVLRLVPGGPSTIAIDTALAPRRTGVNEDRGLLARVGRARDDAQR